MQENLASTMNLIRSSRGLSITEFSEELGIARSSLQDLLMGRGNPRIDTVEYIARQLQVDPLALLAGGCTDRQQQVLLLILNLLQETAELTPDQRSELAGLLTQLAALLESESL